MRGAAVVLSLALPVKIKARHLAILAVGVLIGLGFWLGKGAENGDARSVGDSSKPDEATVAPSIPPLPAVDKEPIQVASEEPGERVEPDADSPTPEVDKMTYAGGPIFLLDRDGKINDGPAAQFAMTPFERVALNEALAQTRQRINELTAQNWEMTEVTPYSIRLRISPFEGGEAAWAEFERSLTSILGQQRAELLLNASLEELVANFHSLGRLPRELNIMKYPQGFYVANIEVSQERDNGWMTGDTKFVLLPDVDHLPPDYEWLGPAIGISMNNLVQQP